MRRDNQVNGAVPLFFARIFGSGEQESNAAATAIFDADIAGFRGDPKLPNPKLLPFTLHVDSWTASFTSGPDAFSHNHETHAVSEAADGIREVKLFPFAISPGNFGAIDIGNPENSLSVQRRQILYGPNDADMAYYPDSTLKIDAANAPSARVAAKAGFTPIRTIDSPKGVLRIYRRS